MNRGAVSKPMWVMVVTLLVLGVCPFLFAQDGAEVEDTATSGAAERASQDDAPPAKGPKDRAAGRRSGPPAGLWKRMSEDERGQLLGFVEQHFPTMFEELERTQGRQLDRFERRMKRIAPDMRHLMETMDTHPKRAVLMIRERRLDIHIRSLVSKYHAIGDQAKRPELRDEIRELLGKAVECRHDRRAAEIREVEKRIAELKRRHQETADSREKIIERELRQRLDRPVRNKPGSKEDE